MANPYSTLITRVVTELTSGLSSYAGIVVIKRKFDPAKLPDFSRYLIVASPPENDMWDERVIGVRNIQYVMSVDLFLLVKNFDDINSLFGETAPDRGIFELVNDVKTLLRASNMNATLDKTYSEPAGPLSIEYSASAGLDSGEHPFIRRAKLRYRANLKPTCYAVVQ